MAILFRATRQLENQIDEYLDTVSEGMIVFGEGVKHYLGGDRARFQERIVAIERLEGTADSLRRLIESSLYSHSLIPEHRGDVLQLLENIDDLIDMAKETLNQFLVEQPLIPEKLNSHYTELTETSIEAAEAVVVATRAFFKNLSAVKDHLHKVYFFEKEADTIGNRLKLEVFESDELDLARKMHLRYFALHIDNIADQAESVADRLTIFAIKRTL